MRGSILFRDVLNRQIPKYYLGATKSAKDCSLSKRKTDKNMGWIVSQVWRESRCRSSESQLVVCRLYVKKHMRCFNSVVCHIIYWISLNQISCKCLWKATQSFYFVSLNFRRNRAKCWIACEWRANILKTFCTEQEVFEAFLVRLSQEYVA